MTLAFPRGNEDAINDAISRADKFDTFEPFSTSNKRSD